MTMEYALVRRIASKGEVTPTIRAVAHESDVDMIVMSTHALTGPASGVLGSVADAVARTSRCPVLLVFRRPGGTLHGLEGFFESQSKRRHLSLTTGEAD